ncbi:hypothetical protein LCGC14_1456340 [marine sediment metagenome]|uniref:Uncharacterized protein n=1 Tax=marine sediment metagenome TaxID=412755 RepID=A0A0F9K2J0_9ZZZZ
MGSKTEVVKGHRPACDRCGSCCTGDVCWIGLTLMGTNRTPCPALEEHDGLTSCGLVADTGRYALVDLALTPDQITTLKTHILRINNFGEGCDMEPWIAEEQEAKQ